MKTNLRSTRSSRTGVNSYNDDAGMSKTIDDLLFLNETEEVGQSIVLMNYDNPANEGDDYLFEEDMYTPLKKGRGRLKQLFQRKLGACTHMTSNDLDAGLDFDADVVEDFRWIKELQLLDTASSKCKSHEHSFIQFCF